MAKAKRINVAVVGGAGVIAGAHCEGITANNRVSKLAGLYDVDTRAVKARAKEYDTKVYSSEKEMLDDPDVDVVMIATPHPLHAEQAIRAFRAGKHVICEKPLAVKVSEADKMLAEAKKAKKLLGVCYQLRALPAIVKAKKIIDDGKLGKIRHIVCVMHALKHDYYYSTAPWRGTWEGEGGGFALNNAPHWLDAMIYMSGMPKRIFGMARTQFQRIEVEDCAFAMMEYENGAVGSFTTNSNVAPSSSRWEIYGDLGSIVVTPTSVTYYKPKEPISKFTKRKKLDSLYAGLPTKEYPQKLPKTLGGHAAVVKSMYDAINGKGKLLASGEEALLSLELYNAITLSSYTGKAVETPISRSAYDRLFAKLVAKGKKAKFEPMAKSPVK